MQSIIFTKASRDPSLYLWKNKNFPPIDFHVFGSVGLKVQLHRESVSIERNTALIKGRLEGEVLAHVERRLLLWQVVAAVIVRALVRKPASQPTRRNLLYIEAQLKCEI